MQTTFAVDVDAIRPLLADGPEATLRAVLATALGATGDPDLQGYLNGDTQAWLRVADSIAERLTQPGPVHLTGQDIQVAIEALYYLGRHCDEFVDYDIALSGPYADWLSRLLERLYQDPALLSGMSSLEHSLDTVAAYSAALLGGHWRAWSDGTTTLLRHTGGYTVLLEEQPPGACEYPIALTAFGDEDANGDSDEQTDALAPEPDHTLHRVATDLGLAVLNLHAEFTASAA